MQDESHDEFVASIAPDVLRCLVRSGFFEKLDGLLSPAVGKVVAQKCQGDYRLSESVLKALGFDLEDLDDIFAVLRSKGGFCDCEILYNVAESSRLKSKYWRAQAKRHGQRT